MNGGEGIPVNSCTIARKFVVSVVRTVVGARREALVLFLVVTLGCKGPEDDGVERIWIWFWVDPSGTVGFLKWVGSDLRTSRLTKELEESELKLWGCKL